MTNQSEESTGQHDEPRIEDLLDETRGPEEDEVHPDGATPGREEVVDDLKPRD